MVTQAIHVIGGPGVGKSTLMASLLDGWSIHENIRLGREVFGNLLDHPLIGPGMYLGVHRPQYPGVDALARSASPHAVKWVESLSGNEYSMIFVDGMRLANRKFIPALAAKTDLTVIHLYAPQEMMAERRDSREDDPKWTTGKSKTGRTGMKQNPTWAKTVITQASNVTVWCQEEGIRVISVDASEKPEDALDAVLKQHVFLRNLRR